MTLMFHISRLRYMMEYKNPDFNDDDDTTATNRFEAIYKNFLTKPSVKPGWYSSSAITKQVIVGGFVVGAAGGFPIDILVAYRARHKAISSHSKLITAVKAGRGRHTRNLAIFFGTYDLIRMLLKNVVYLGRGGEKLVMDDIVIDGLSGAVAGLVVFPVRTFMKRGLTFAAIEAFLSKLDLLKL